MTLRTQFRVLAWAAKTFGPTAMDRQERAARLVEEAIEVAQVEGVPLAVLMKIADRVYSRPPGEISQEIGGTMITLQAMAERAGLNLDECADREWDRVCSIPVGHFRAKHAAKVAAGTAGIGRATEEVQPAPAPVPVPVPNLCPFYHITETERSLCTYRPNG